jgi:thioredoxin 1
MAELVDVTEANFDEEVLQSETPALVDFWGDHCPACRQISPILKELADEHAGRIKIVKLHAAENPGLSARYGVLSMPTVLGFSSGEVVGQLVGARPKSAFEELIERLR